MLCVWSRIFLINIDASDRKLIWLERSGHVITEDYEADIVKREVMIFLAN